MTWFKVPLKAPPPHFKGPIREYARVLSERREWCNEHAGEYLVSWDVNPISSGDTRIREYSFKDSKIAMLFQLRWS